MKVGSIEQDADLVIFIYRDEYYNDESPTSRASPRSIWPSTETARPDSVKLSFLRRYTKFADLAAHAVNDRQVIWVRAGRPASPVSASECLSSPEPQVGTYAYRAAKVEGHLRSEADVGFTRCHRGHRDLRAPRWPA